MHIAALAAALKVTPRKLDALENDRYDELLDATFARALAQTVCRTLKIDAEPVLSKLPQPIDNGMRLGSGLNAPLREGMRRDNGERSALSRPVVWGSMALVVAAMAIYLLPSRWLGLRTARAPDAAASAVVPAASAAALGTMPIPASMPASSPLPAASGEVASAPSGPASVASAARVSFQGLPVPLMLAAHDESAARLELK